MTHYERGTEERKATDRMERLQAEFVKRCAHMEAAVIRMRKLDANNPGKFWTITPEYRDAVEDMYALTQALSQAFKRGMMRCIA